MRYVELCEQCAKSRRKVSALILLTLYRLLHSYASSSSSISGSEEEKQLLFCQHQFTRQFAYFSHCEQLLIVESATQYVDQTLPYVTRVMRQFTDYRQQRVNFGAKCCPKARIQKPCFLTLYVVTPGGCFDKDYTLKLVISDKSSMFITDYRILYYYIVP